MPKVRADTSSKGIKHDSDAQRLSVNVTGFQKTKIDPTSQRIRVTGFLDFIGLNPRFSSDNTTATDQIASFDFTKVLGDTANTGDDVNLQVDFNRDFADTVNVSDLVSVVSDFLRGFADTVATSDSAILQITKALSDSAGAVDAGIINVSNYTTGTYFAEDYTGANTIF